MVEVLLIELTPENRSQMLELATSMHVGEKCIFCDKVYESVEMLKDVVYAGDCSLACNGCWKKAHPEGELDNKKGE